MTQLIKEYQVELESREQARNLEKDILSHITNVYYGKHDHTTQASIEATVSGAQGKDLSDLVDDTGEFEVLNIQERVEKQGLFKKPKIYTAILVSGTSDELVEFQNYMLIQGIKTVAVKDVDRGVLSFRTKNNQENNQESPIQEYADQIDGIVDKNFPRVEKKLAISYITLYYNYTPYQQYACSGLLTGPIDALIQIKKLLSENKLGIELAHLNLTY